MDGLMTPFAQAHEVVGIIGQGLPADRVGGTHEGDDMMHVLRRHDMTMLQAALAQGGGCCLPGAELLPARTIVHGLALHVLLAASFSVGLAPRLSVILLSSRKIYSRHTLSLYVPFVPYGHDRRTF